MTRDMIKTLGSNQFIYIEIIDAWAFILSRKSIKVNHKRIFFPSNAFFFFPAYAYNHFYVVIINTKLKPVEVMDNRPLLDNV
ncbi:EGF-like domain-containing protein comC [Bienertia sinuspersici]